MHLIEHIETLFMLHGQRPYGEQGPVPLTALQHALQCAQLAEWAYADDALVAAALLHDLVDFIDGAEDDEHEQRVLALLRDGFGAPVSEPIRLQVQAKRYLATTDAQYAERLTPTAVYLLARQGGAMPADEVHQFEELPYAADAVALQRWADLARQPAKRTPPLAYYLHLLETLQERPFVDSKIGIGSFSVA